MKQEESNGQQRQEEAQKIIKGVKDENLNFKKFN
jgi:hypothetical protein